MNKIYLSTSKGSNIATYIYDDVINPKAVVQIVHGAAEHFTRYEEFIDYLNENGYIALGCDILGHGDSCHSDQNIIYFEEKEAYESVVLVKNYAERTFPSLPLYIFGHSMGSLITRKLLIDYPKSYTKAILSGSTTMSPCITTFGRFLGTIVRIFRGKKKFSPFLSNLSFGDVNKLMIKKGLLHEGEMWLTHDPVIADYYKNSPICGENISIEAQRAIYYWSDYCFKKKNIKKGNQIIPILLIAGSEDPISYYGENIKVTTELYKKCNYEFIESIVYDNFRHEVINEIGREKVYKDCLNFFNK